MTIPRLEKNGPLTSTWGLTNVCVNACMRVLSTRPALPAAVRDAGMLIRTGDCCFAFTGVTYAGSMVVAIAQTLGRTANG